MVQQFSEHPLISYYVDTNGIITSINDAWLAFARENNWHVDEQDIIGENLWRYIENDAVKHLYRLAMEKTFSSGEPVSFSYHCDSAELVRKLRMKISFDRVKQQYMFNNKILSILKRKPVDILRNDIPRSEEHLTICSWCKDINISHDQWVDVEQAVNKLNFFSKKLYPQLSHGVCPQCRTNMMEI